MEKPRRPLLAAHHILKQVRVGEKDWECRRQQTASFYNCSEGYCHVVYGNAEILSHKCQLPNVDECIIHDVIIDTIKTHFVFMLLGSLSPFG